MGRYNDEAYLNVKYDNTSSLLTNEVRVGKSDVRLITSYDTMEIRLNLVPYTKNGDLLLHKALRRPNGVITRPLEMPQRLLTVPKDYELAETITKQEFREILFDNLYRAIMSDAGDVSGYVRFGEDSVYGILHRMGLAGTFSYSIWVDPSPAQDPTEHLVDVYMMLRVEYTQIESEFNYVPTELFEQFSKTRYPESYATAMGFYPEDYDETSTDFRMNPKGKKQVCAAIGWIRNKGVG